MDLVVRTYDASSPGSREIEVVERKGLGHPDTICDALAEQVCIHLSRYYLQHFDHVLHHNVDKILLVGGTSRPSFGGGEMREPIELYLAGRTTQEHDGEVIPVNDIAVEACREWLRRNIRGLNVDRDVKIVPRFHPGSADLVRLFGARGAAPLANDTSCGVGFAPLTDLERVVLEVERRLNDVDTKRAHPEIGEDIKVLGIRRRDRIDLTIACAFVGRHVRDANDYVKKKASALALALEAARRVTRFEVAGRVNTADDVETGNVFLTVTGTSAEAGDDGEVGRGNRTNGLITPYRAMTLEAAAGKNPVSHVGKLYNVVASRVAASIVADVPHVTGAECVLVSEIGRSLADPQLVDVSLVFEGGAKMSGAKALIARILQSQLEELPALGDALLQERLRVY